MVSLNDKKNKEASDEVGDEIENVKAKKEKKSKKKKNNSQQQHSLQNVKNQKVPFSLKKK